MPAANDHDVWGSAVEAASLLACDPKQVPKLASKGFITVRRLPGCDPRYLMSDVKRLASQATVPATITSQRASTVEGVTEAHGPSEPAGLLCKNGGVR
jgi:hypothetical protein